MFQNELHTAVKAAKQGAEAIRFFLESGKSMNIRHKGLHDLVTEADLASEKAIKEIIAAAFPDDRFLAEESSSDAGLQAERTWIIDPIDGTTNFAHGIPFYAISIALYIDFMPVVGVVLAPAANELFSAVAGQGAYLNHKPIQVSTVTDPMMALLGTGFPYRDLSVIDDYMKLFYRFMKETQGVRRPGSASYDLCYIASGRYDGFFEYALAPWDVAAGALIIREAGGVVTDWTGGQDWLFGKRIIAGNEAIHRFLLQAIGQTISPNVLSLPK